jgi:prolyl oligopeptidase
MGIRWLKFAMFFAMTMLLFAADEIRFAYPKARKTDQIDDYHGVKVADPYRWLEDDHSAETKAWVEGENKVTFAFLDAIPERARIKERLTKLWNYERFGTPFKKGGDIFTSETAVCRTRACCM